MARWLFFLLLVANLGVLVWFARFAQPSAPVLAPLPDGVPTILLASESRTRSSGDAKPEASVPAVRAEIPNRGSVSSRAGEPSQPQPEAPEPAAECQRFGPFQQQSETAQLLWELSEQGITAQVQVVQDKRPSGYLVLLKPDKAALKSVQQKLQAAGISDAWLVSKGEFANALALGLFSDQESADKRAAEVKGKGFHPKVEPRLLDDSSYWLQAAYPAGFQDHKKIVTRIYESYPQLTYPPAACTKIASP